MFGANQQTVNTNGRRNSNSIVSRSSCNMPSINGSNAEFSLESKSCSTNPASLASSAGANSNSPTIRINPTQTTPLPAVSTPTPVGSFGTMPLINSAFGSLNGMSRQGSSQPTANNFASGKAQLGVGVNLGGGSGLSRPLPKDLSGPASPLRIPAPRVPLPLESSPSPLAQKHNNTNNNLNTNTPSQRIICKSLSPNGGSAYSLLAHRTSQELASSSLRGPVSFAGASSPQRRIQNALNANLVIQLDGSYSQLQQPQAEVSTSHKPPYAVTGVPLGSNLPPSCAYSENRLGTRSGSPLFPSPPASGNSGAQAPHRRLPLSVNQGGSKQDCQHENILSSDTDIEPSSPNHPHVFDNEVPQLSSSSPIRSDLLQPDLEGKGDTLKESTPRSSLSGAKAFGIFQTQLVSSNSDRGSSKTPQKRVGSASSTSNRDLNASPYCLPVQGRRTSSAVAGPLLRHSTAASMGDRSSSAVERSTENKADCVVAYLELDQEHESSTSDESNSGTVSRTTSGATAITDLSPRIVADVVTASDSCPNSHSPSSASPSSSPFTKRSMVPKHFANLSTMAMEEMYRTSSIGGPFANSIEGFKYQTSLDDLMALGSLMANARHKSEGQPSEPEGASRRLSTVSASTEDQTPAYGFVDIPLRATGERTRKIGERVVFLSDNNAQSHGAPTNGVVAPEPTCSPSQGAVDVSSSSATSTPSVCNVPVETRKRSTSDMDSRINRTASGESMIGMADPRRLMRPDFRKSIITKNAERFIDDADMESINDYFLESKICSTKASTVYIGVDPVTDCKYAIKVMQRVQLTSGWDSVVASAAVSRVNSRATPAHMTPRSVSEVIPLATEPRRPLGDGNSSVIDLDGSFVTKKTRSLANTPQELPMEPKGSGGVHASYAGNTSTTGSLVGQVASYTGSTATVNIVGKPTFIGADMIHIDPILEKKCREVAIMKEANCVYFVRLHEAILDPRHRFMYLVMEYVSGGRLLKPSIHEGWQYQPLPSAKVLYYTKQLITALCFLHAKGIVHRDIKPENILLDVTHDQIKITDFGVSETIKNGGKVYPGNVAGTPMFLAPEAFGKDPFEAMPLDVWAFGVTVFAMATGKLPFKGGSYEEVGSNIVNTIPEYPDDMHPALRMICKRCLVKDPAKRITMGQLWYASLRDRDRAAVVLPADNRAFYEIQGPSQNRLCKERGSLTADNLKSLGGKDAVKRRTHRSGSKRYSTVPKPLFDAIADAPVDITHTALPSPAAGDAPMSTVEVPTSKDIGTVTSSLPVNVDKGADFHEVILSVAMDGGGLEEMREDLFSERNLGGDDLFSQSDRRTDSLISPEQRSPTSPSKSLSLVRSPNGDGSRIVDENTDERAVVSTSSMNGLLTNMTRGLMFKGADLALAVPAALRSEAPDGGTANGAKATHPHDIMEGSANFADDNASFNLTTNDIAALLGDLNGVEGDFGGLTNGSFAFTTVADLLKNNAPRVDVTDQDLENAFVIAKPQSCTPRRTPESTNESRHQAYHDMGTPFSVSRVPSEVQPVRIETTETTPRGGLLPLPEINRLETTHHRLSTIPLAVKSNDQFDHISQKSGTLLPPKEFGVAGNNNNMKSVPTPRRTDETKSYGETPLLTPRPDNPLATLPPSVLSSPETAPNALAMLLKRRLGASGVAKPMEGSISNSIASGDVLSDASHSSISVKDARRQLVLSDT